MELQITQEYTGQQSHLVYLLPMWKQVLDFDMRIAGQSTPVREIVAGKTYQRPYGGLVGVANVGMDANGWLTAGDGQPLCLRPPGVGPRPQRGTIAEEWTRQTFGNDATTVVHD